MRSSPRLAAAATAAALLLGGCATVPPRALVARTAPVPAPTQVNAVVDFPLPKAASPFAATDPTAPSVPVEEPATPTPTAPTTDPTPPPGPDQPTEPGVPSEPDCAVLKCVALTMDDGPSPGTGRILDLFAKKGVKATFFLLGEHARKNQELVRRMVAEGHEVGNHSWSHPEFWYLSKRAIKKQLVRTNRLLAKLGQRPQLVRPPYGEWDSDVAKVTKALGMPSVIWDVDPEDWKYRNAKKVTKRVLKQVHRGSIILTHDTLKTTRKAIPAIVKALQDKGYTLVTVSQLMVGKLHAGKRCYRAQSR